MTKKIAEQIRIPYNNCDDCIFKSPSICEKCRQGNNKIKARESQILIPFGKEQKDDGKAEAV